MISKENNIPPLNGLVLAGGKSMRMGTDKDLLKWHGKEQRYFAADLIREFCEEVYISCRQEQANTIDNTYNTLPDTFLNMGPFGGILSAMRFQRNCAWIVIACDLPLLNKATIQYLVSNRDTQKLATTYKSPHDGLPEPLITIWEPAAYPILLNFLGNNITCPRKVLINNNVSILKPLQPDALMNVNTPEDAKIAEEIMNKI